MMPDYSNQGPECMPNIKDHFLSPLMENTSAYMMLAVLGTIFVTHVKHAGGESYGVLE